MHTLNRKYFTSALKLKGPLSHDDPPNGYLGQGIFNLLTIIILDVVRIRTEATCLVEPERNLRLNGPVLPEAPAYEEVCRYRWMMADLLNVDGTTVNKTLICLS